MNNTFETFNKENRLELFGNEDAGREDDQRLASYYYKTQQYEDIMSKLSLQIVTGEKGTGKSALLKIAYLESKGNDVIPIWIRMDDLSEQYDEILQSENLYMLKTLWKRAISKMIVMKLAGLINTNDHILSEDYQKATQWAYDSGYLSRDFIRQALRMLKPIYESKINLDGDYTSNGEQHILKRMIDNKKIRLFFDDFDLDWKGKKEDVIKIKRLLLSLSDMTTDME